MFPCCLIVGFSVKVVTGRVTDPLQRPELLCFNGALSLGVLQRAFYDEAGRADDERSMLTEEVRMDDGLRDSGLVFQRQEDESFRSARPLSDDDRAGRRHAASVGKFLQIDRKSTRLNSSHRNIS